jgi:hypothetical protein
MTRHNLLPLLAATALVSAACTGWHNSSGVAEGVAQANSGEIRVYRADGSNVRLVRASIVGDSLVGFSAGSGARVAIPTSAIVSTETKHVSAGRTAALGGGILIGAAVVGIISLAVALGAAY